jgi:hypothetical protein
MRSGDGARRLRPQTLMWAVAVMAFSPALTAQTLTITATAKGPDQINLTWTPVANPVYGYLVEIQSDGDSRYTSWTELDPMPAAGGFTCDPTVVWSGGTCNISDPTGVHVYNPPTHGIPMWVTDSTYIDPQDGSAAQMIAWGLKSNVTYNFRVRTYTGNSSPVYGAYSNTASALSASYVQRYVSPAGNDANDGTAADGAHAWRTLAHGSSAIVCGQELIVMGGSYATDGILMPHNCSAGNKAVVMVNPGDTATIVSLQSGSSQSIILRGNYIVIDGLRSATAASTAGEYVAMIVGNHNAFLNVEIRPAVIPSFYYGVGLFGDHNLLYRSYLHDFGSPDAVQNPGGNGGWILEVAGAGAVNNVIWSNHLTRGGHDESFCTGGCSYNRWLNNVMDGGWGQAWAAVFADGVVSEHNLLEGNVMKDIGRGVTAYKPAMQLSQGRTTVRRNTIISPTVGLEESYFYGGTAANNLVYNNVFYNGLECIFQSHNGGVTAYDNDVYSNNICYKISNIGIDIYLNNTTNQISYNDILNVDVNGAPLTDQLFITWNHEAEGDFQYPKSLSYANTVYNPPFSQNLAVIPKFVDEANLDLHLTASSSLIGAGTPVTDPDWGSPTGRVDLGPYGISTLGARAPVGSSCSNSLAGGLFTFGASGGDSSASLTAPAGCTWSASSNVPWIVITSKQPNSGNSAVTYRVAPNDSNSSRTGLIMIAGSGYGISEAGATGCIFTLDTTGATVQSGGGNIVVQVAVSASNCVWSAAGNAWAAVISGASSMGNGAVTMTVQPNFANVSRWVPVTIAGQQYVVAQTEASAPAGTRFVTVTPCRLIDTRPNSGFTGQFGTPFLFAGVSRDFALAAGNCNVPGDARAYSLNITVVPLEPLAFLTAWPAGQQQPLVSTLNAADGSIIANAAILPAGSGGAISLYASNATDVVVDVNGYFVDSSRADALAFYPLSPCRIVDTRSAKGLFGGPSLTGGALARDFPIPSGPCNVPTAAGSYSLNFTVVPRGSLSFLTAWPSGLPQPTVSTLNSAQGEVLANAAIIPAAATGGISVYAQMPLPGTTDVIIDTNGYFAVPGSAGALSFYPVKPCRVVDTRSGQGTSGEFGPPSMTGGATRTFTLPAAPCGIPASARAYSLNFTVVPTGPLSYLSAWATGQSQPVVSTLNSASGKILANAAIVPAGTNGAINVYTLTQGNSSTDVIIDVNGYFAP